MYFGNFEPLIESLMDIQVAKKYLLEFKVIKALGEIRGLILGLPFEREFIERLDLLESQFNKVEKEKNLSLVSDSDANVIYGRITKAVLSILDELYQAQTLLKQNEFNGEDILGENSYDRTKYVEEKRWNKYPLIKSLLIRFGYLDIEDVEGDHDYYTFSKYSRAKRIRSYSRLIQFIELEQAKARRSKLIIRKLYHTANMNVVHELNRNAKFKGQFSNDECAELKLIEHRIKEEILFVRDKIDEIKNEINLGRELRKVSSSIEGYRRKRNVKFPNVIIKIDLTDAMKLINGYLWYINDCSPSFPSTFKQFGDWINIGDDVITTIKSPIEGVIMNYYVQNELLIVPVENWEMPPRFIEIMFGELIELCETALDRGINPNNKDLSYYRHALDSLKDTKYEVEEMKEEFSKFFRVVSK